MAKYVFKVYLSGGSEKIITLPDIENTDLFDMDRYVVENGGYFQLIHKLADNYNLPVNQIEKVTILRLKKEIEFSILSHNPYLEPVLNNLEKKKILGYGNHLTETTVVSRENESFQNMKEYLFKNLKENYQSFLENVYKYHNEFSNLLYRYGSIYHHGIYSEEEIKNVRELELRIETELSIYKNFRGLCLARQQSEKYGKSNTHQTKKDSKVSHLEVKSNIPITKINLQPIAITQEQANQTNSYINDLGEEKEEFLDPEEIERFR